MPKKKKKHHHEEHVDETWLIPYADMLTLLLALFIVMFAMGQIDKKKFEQFGSQFNIIFSGGSGFFDKDGNVVIPSPNPNPNAGGASGTSLSLTNSKSKTQLEEDKMKEIKTLLENEIVLNKMGDKIKLVLNKDSLEISIQDTVLFPSGEAVVFKNVTPILNLIAQVLAEIDNNVRVVGHTDNMPIKNDHFRSNWDLSAIRAINVMEFLVAKGKLDPMRFIIQGNGEYSPKYDNSTVMGRAQNRRVEIFIIRRYPVQNEPIVISDPQAPQQ